MICLIVGLIKIISLYKMTHFPEPFDYTFKKLSLELNLVSYATKSALKKKQVLMDENLLKNWFSEVKIRC